MNLLMNEATALNKAINQALAAGNYQCEVYHFAPALYLTTLLEEAPKVTIGAQNAHPKKNGAFTGEISMHQLINTGIKSVLIGHSERRQLFNETDAFLKEKVDAAIAEGVQVFFCCGETLAQRNAGNHFQLVIQQLQNALFHLTEEDFKKVVIAYEPIWAIGTGKTATPEQANEMHQQLRKAIAAQYSEKVAGQTTILYGGSCKPSNAKELLSQSDIDGGLIGGASLNAEDFMAIIANYQHN